MPSYAYESQKKTVNYYGVFALWASILILASYFVLYTSGCGDVSSLEIQCIMAGTFAVGILIFLLSFCNIAVRLFYKKFIFYLIVTILVSLAFGLLYCAYRTLGQQCQLTLYYERNVSLLPNMTSQHEQIKKTFQAMNHRRSEHYTVSAVLDLIAGLLFIASGYAFRHRF